MVASAALTEPPVRHRPLGHVIGGDLVAGQGGHGDGKGRGAAACPADGAGLAVGLIPPPGVRLIVVDHRGLSVGKGDVAVVGAVVPRAVCVANGHPLVLRHDGVEQRGPVLLRLGEAQPGHVGLRGQVPNGDVQHPVGDGGGVVQLAEEQILQGVIIHNSQILFVPDGADGDKPILVHAAGAVRYLIFIVVRKAGQDAVD